jgi:hypothetical protein
MPTPTQPSSDQSSWLKRVAVRAFFVGFSQYISNGIKVVVPMLFGFTEQARRVKQTVTVTQRKARKWDWESVKQD